MSLRQRQWVGAMIFVLMFGNFGVGAYSTWLSLSRLGNGSYDGWSSRLQSDGRLLIVSVDAGGPASALRRGDELVSINGLTRREDVDIANFNRRVPPGTRYLMLIRRQGQLLEIPLVTTAYAATRWIPPLADLLVQLLFLLTGLIVFLLKASDKQAWLLAIMLGTFTGLFNSELAPLPPFLLTIVVVARVAGLLFLPVFLHFFLIFPERSPLLNRFSRLEGRLYWPLALMLPLLSVNRLIVIFRLYPSLNAFVRNLGILNNRWIGLLTLSIVLGYLAAGLVALVIGYRSTGVAARRKLIVIAAGSGAGVLNLLLLIVWESFFSVDSPWVKDWLELALKFTLPLIPLSFAYAIFRHKVIPVSLILRRGVRYVLVSRGSLALHLLLSVLVMFLLMETLFGAKGRTIGVISTVVGILLWNLNSWLHRRVLAPAIDRHFFRQSYDAQQIITGLTQSLRSVTSLPELLELVAAKIQSALQTESVTIFLRDRNEDDFQSVHSLHHQTAGESDAEDQRLSAKAQILRRLTTGGEPLEINAAEESPDKDGQTLREMNAALLLPLTAKGDAKEELMGLIVLGPRLGDLPFSRADKDLLMSVAGPAGFAIENSQLVERMVAEARRREEIEAENEQRAKELEEARQLQLSMLPKQLPQLPNLEIAAYMKTATEVGGDYYDFHLTTDSTLTVAVGDATGHGLKAGTMVTAMKSLFHCFAEEPELLPAMNRSSRVLKKMNLRSLFMGLTVVKLHGNSLKISSAGMPPMLIHRSRDRHIEEVLIKAMPLGSISSYNYREEEFELMPGDVVVLMSDGLPERFNTEGEMFDYHQVREVLAATATHSPREIIEALAAAGDAWANGRPQDDDITFVVLKLRS